MTIKTVNLSQKVQLENGVALWLPTNILEGLVNLTAPNIYAQSSVQLYPLGSKAEFADGRVFRYGKFGATSTNVPLARMVVNANACGGCTGFAGTDSFEGNLYVAAVAGQEYLDLWTIIAASGTGIKTSVYPKNFFEDGMLAFYPASGGPYAEIRICGNDESVTPVTRIYLDAPIPVALTVGTTASYQTTGTITGSVGGAGVTAYSSLFSQLKDGVAEGSTFTSAMGVFLGPTFTSGYYGWIQRAGRCIVTPTGYFGDTADERMAQLHTDGCIALKAAHGTHTVGYLTQRTASGYGDLEVWLQLE